MIISLAYGLAKVCELYCKSKTSECHVQLSVIKYKIILCSSTAIARLCFDARFALRTFTAFCCSAVAVVAVRKQTD
jgi:hypothetical protein